MNIKEYQKEAIKFATFGNKMENEYLALGLSGEVGEVLNKLKKVIRDDDGQLMEDAARHIALEVGDVLWYVVTIAHKEKIRLLFTPHKKKNVPLKDAITFGMEVMYQSFRTSDDLVDGRLSFPPNRLLVICSALELLSNFAGYTLEEVADMNIQKLTDRKNRGKIGGSGDDR